jgi:3-oxoacyl-[acyl-carrier protein] reductase
MDDVLTGGPDMAGEELFARTVAQREHPESTESLVELVMFLLGPASSGVTGRLLSARWDSIDAIAAWPRSGDPSRYALRRIDHELFHSETTTR